uniref:2-oxoglutarate and iron dependent oxygenase domain containing 3 n=1 Tax=Oryctolagus cuniculus TaxID=9986 RepID=A0A5F9C6W1_RABIT
QQLFPVLSTKKDRALREVPGACLRTAGLGAGLALAALLLWSSLGTDDGVTEVLARRGELVAGRFVEVPCSEDYDGHRRFEGCTPRKCGRGVSDVVITREEAQRIRSIAEKGLSLGGSHGGAFQASILDLHSGALSVGKHFVNLYRYFGDKIQNIFSDEDFQLYRAVRQKVQLAIAEAFGISASSLYLTKPTFFSRINSTEAQTAHDEYWHTHVDKVSRPGRPGLPRACCHGACFGICPRGSRRSPDVAAVAGERGEAALKEQAAVLVLTSVLARARPPRWTGLAGALQPLPRPLLARVPGRAPPTSSPGSLGGRPHLLTRVPGRPPPPPHPGSLGGRPHLLARCPGRPPPPSSPGCPGRPPPRPPRPGPLGGRPHLLTPGPWEAAPHLLARVPGRPPPPPHPGPWEAAPTSSPGSLGGRPHLLTRVPGRPPPPPHPGPWEAAPTSSPGSLGGRPHLLVVAWAPCRSLTGLFPATALCCSSLPRPQTFCSDSRGHCLRWTPRHPQTRDAPSEQPWEALAQTQKCHRGLSVPGPRPRWPCPRVPAALPAGLPLCVC